MDSRARIGQNRILILGWRMNAVQRLVDQKVWEGCLMGFRYRRSAKLAPGIRLNITGRGISSVSIGKQGLHLNIGKKGTRQTISLPGSGLSYSNRSSTTPALATGLAVGGLLALLIHASRGSVPAQIALAMIGFCGLAFLISVSNAPPQSTTGDASTIKATTGISSENALSLEQRRKLDEIFHINGASR
ncbi:DUF4236 domain-containing protein [Methylocystis bryophila]